MDPILVIIVVILLLVLFYLIVSGTKYTGKKVNDTTPKIANLNRFRVKDISGMYLAVNKDSGRMYMTKEQRKAGVFIIREVTTDFFYLEEQSTKFFVQFAYPINYANRYDVFCNGTAHESEGNTSLLKMKWNKKNKMFTVSFYNGHSLVYSPEDLLVYSSGNLKGNTKIYCTLDTVE